MEELEQLSGVVERQIFRNEDNGFTVVRIKNQQTDEFFTVVGVFPKLTEGNDMCFSGKWVDDPRRGKQFQAKECKPEPPNNIHSIKRFLSSGLLKGIGARFADKIIETFGLDTLEIIDKSPEKLLTISGIGESKLSSIIESWKKHSSIRSLILFGFGIGLAIKIQKTLGLDAISSIQANPFILSERVSGIGFKTADSIAKMLGTSPLDSSRIIEGIKYIILCNAEEGHTCTPLEELESKLILLLFDKQIELTPEEASLLVKNHIEIAIQKGILINNEMDGITYAWNKKLWTCEQNIVRNIKRLTKARCSIRDINLDTGIDWVEKQLNITFAEIQKEAILTCLCNKIVVITGGPGTGKSTITNAILKITEKLTKKIILAAPTGRAAKRLSEITLHYSQTIHSLLQYDFGSKNFKKNKSDPLDCDLIIIDECSMIDTVLMSCLLDAIPCGARIILVGDHDQLPSVGPGSILKDIIDSNIIPIKILNEIFRQATTSRIVTNAHAINNGQFPDISFIKNDSFIFIKQEDPNLAAEKIVELVSNTLPKIYKLHPTDDIQVLVPMKKGLLGIEVLNSKLKQKLNPNQESLLKGSTSFSKNDKVMQIRNNYKKEVFNGDIGRVVRIEIGPKKLLVAFDEKLVNYEFGELDELVLAYATSIHKYQGSESPCIVMPVHTTHFMMLQKNLLYTGITRGKKLVVLVGTGKAIAIALSRHNLQKRHTGLLHSMKIS